MNGSLRALSTSVGTAIAGEPRLARRARPIVVGAGEAVQRRGDGVVEHPTSCARGGSRARVEQARKALRHRQRLGLQRAQE